MQKQFFSNKTKKVKTKEYKSFFENDNIRLEKNSLKKNQYNRRVKHRNNFSWDDE